MLDEEMRLIEASAHDFVCGEDGFWIFWPTENHGAYSARSLRVLADELDRRNVGVLERLTSFLTGETTA